MTKINKIKYTSYLRVVLKSLKLSYFFVRLSNLFSYSQTAVVTEDVCHHVMKIKFVVKREELIEIPRSLHCEEF